MCARYVICWDFTALIISDVMVVANDAAGGNMAATKLLHISLTLRGPLSLDSQPFPSLKLWFPHPEFGYSAKEYLAYPTVSNANSALPQESQFHRHMFQYVNSPEEFNQVSTTAGQETR